MSRMEKYVYQFLDNLFDMAERVACYVDQPRKEPVGGSGQTIRFSADDIAEAAAGC